MNFSYSECKNLQIYLVHSCLVCVLHLPVKLTALLVLFLLFPDTLSGHLQANMLSYTFDSLGQNQFLKRHSGIKFKKVDNHPWRYCGAYNLADVHLSLSSVTQFCSFHTKDIFILPAPSIKYPIHISSSCFIIKHFQSENKFCQFTFLIFIEPINSVLPHTFLLLWI